MRIFGKTLSEYVRFQRSVLVVVALTALIRLGLSLGGVPNSTVKWVSVSVVGLLGVAYYAFALHRTGFGRYRELLAMVFIQNALTQALIAGAIALAIATWQDNIYTAPEYSVDIRTGAPGEGKTWMHAGGHAVFGMTFGTILAWGIGSVILFGLGKLSPRIPSARGVDLV